MSTKENTSPKGNDELLGIVEISALVGVTTQRVRNAMLKGELKFKKVPVKPGSKQVKNVSTREQIKAWRDKVGNHRTTRADGRTKFVTYMDDSENELFKAWKAKNAPGIVHQRANKTSLQKKQEALAKLQAKPQS